MKIEPQIHITPERIEAVKAAHPLTDVVPKYAGWDKRTKKWLCPIHKEKSGSFSITPDVQLLELWILAVHEFRKVL